MPDKGKKKKKDAAFSELSKDEQLKRARAARMKANAVLKGSATKARSNSKSERAAAFKAQKAAERVETRLTGKAPSKISKGPPSTFKGAARDLVNLAKRAASLPGKLAGGFESAKEASEAGSSKGRKKGITIP
jgi:hypothetical protein